MSPEPASAETIRAAYARIREEVGPGVTIVAATKYASLEQMALLAEAGVEVVGENRAQDLERKHAVYGDTFRWHFIGRLQSNKVKIVNRICELVHSLESESAARRLEVPALVEVNLSGEESKAGIAPDGACGLPGVVPAGARPDDDAARVGRSRGLTAGVPPPPGARGRPRPRRALDGNEPGLPSRGRGGRDADPRRSCSLRPVR